MNVFDFVKSITYVKKDIMDSTNEAEYNPFVVNRSLSYFPDTVGYANEMNQSSFLSNRMQYDFLREAIKPKKRFAQWHKKVEGEDLDIIKEYYGYNSARAVEALMILTPDQIQDIRDRLFKGGLTAPK